MTRILTDGPLDLVITKREAGESNNQWERLAQDAVVGWAAAQVTQTIMGADSTEMELRNYLKEYPKATQLDALIHLRKKALLNVKKSND